MRPDKKFGGQIPVETAFGPDCLAVGSYRTLKTGVAWG